MTASTKKAITMKENNEARPALRIRYMSDLHLEFSDYQPPPVDADIVVLAGDIHTGTEGLEWAARTFPDTIVLYLAGNHEYYDQNLLTLMPALEDRASTLGIHLLDNKEFVIGNVRFLGTTLWTDFELRGGGDYAMQIAAEGMNDYQLIRHGTRALQPADTRALHVAGRYFLEEKLQEPFDGKTVVISHHAPSLRSLPMERQLDPLASAYASNLEALAELADFWIHGHTHERLEYRLGRCWVLCNPRGYQMEFLRQRTGFDDRALVVV